MPINTALLSLSHVTTSKTKVRLVELNVPSAVMVITGGERNIQSIVDHVNSFKIVCLVKKTLKRSLGNLPFATYFILFYVWRVLFYVSYLCLRKNCIYAYIYIYIYIYVEKNLSFAAVNAFFKSLILFSC